MDLTVYQATYYTMYDKLAAMGVPRDLLSRISTAAATAAGEKAAELGTRERVLAARAVESVTG